MGITAKKICGVCGKNIGTLSAIYINYEMRDDCYLCSDCRSKCSQFLDGLQIASWTKEDAIKHIQNLENMKLKIENEFVETDAICSAFDQKKLLCIDAKHGWFYSTKYPEIFRFDQIKTWDLDISTTVEDTGLHLIKYKPPRAEMPVPDRMESLNGMDFTIKLRNHPYANEIYINICGGNASLLQSYGSYLDKAYQTAEEFYKKMEKYAGKNMKKKKKNTKGTIVFYD